MTQVRNDVAAQRPHVAQDRQSAETAPSSVPFEVLVADVQGRQGRSPDRDTQEPDRSAHVFVAGTAADRLAMSDAVRVSVPSHSLRESEPSISTDDVLSGVESTHEPAPASLRRQLDILSHSDGNRGVVLELTGTPLSFLEAGPLVLRKLLDRLYEPMTSPALEGSLQTEEPLLTEGLPPDDRAAVFRAPSSATAERGAPLQSATSRPGQTFNSAIRSPRAAGTALSAAAQLSAQVRQASTISVEEAVGNPSEAQAIRAELIDAMEDGHLSELSLSVTRGETGLIVQVGMPSLDARQQRLLEQRLTSLIESHGRNVERFGFDSAHTPSPEFSIDPSNERTG